MAAHAVVYFLHRIEKMYLCKKCEHKSVSVKFNPFEFHHRSIHTKYLLTLNGAMLAFVRAIEKLSIEQLDADYSEYKLE